MDLVTSAELSARADEAMRAGEVNTAISSLEAYVLLVPSDHDHWLKLAGARRAIGDLTGALDASAAANRSRPNSFLAMLMGASLLEAMGRQEDAARAYRLALDLAPDDRRLPGTIRRQLDRGLAICAKDSAWRRCVATLDIPQTASPIARRRLSAFQDQIVGRGAGDPVSLIYPGLQQLCFYEAGALPGISQLEREATAVRAEFEAIAAIRSGRDPDHQGVAVASNGSCQWSVISLWRDGSVVEENASLCPITMRLYEALRPPHISGRSPNLMFSILDGHSRIPPHSGVTNTRLVLHLPLILPEQCGIRVANETRQWSRGRALLFDDTFEHEVWNDSNRQRVILLGDLWHPDLEDVERNQIADMLGAPRT